MSHSERSSNLAAKLNDSAQSCKNSISELLRTVGKQVTLVLF